ncbi:MAG: 2-oxoglutarate dehydrogenase E1 component [Bernardetiaceae bacterium]
MSTYSYISNAEGQYIDNLYKDYQNDPASVDESWQRFFEGFDFYQSTATNGNAPATDSPLTQKEIGVRRLISAYRLLGHLEAKTNPVRERKDRKARLELSNFGLSEDDLDTVFEGGQEIGIGTASLRDIVAALRKIYTGAIGFEYMSIREPEIWDWFKQKAERDFLNYKLSIDDKKHILSMLNKAVGFESFLHTKFIGQKRFSLEGGESTIPALDAIITKAADMGTEEVIIGMAHRGRLNILANILGKTYDTIFEEFEGSAMPDETLGSGDVKYHMGFSSRIKTKNGKEVDVKIIPNPSHLEAVDPVVTGFARAKLDGIYKGDRKKILPILIHGDAAVAGQGIVYEVIQMSLLEGYGVGGTIHLVINNQVGFTTDFDDARSSHYCTDISQIVEAPEIHVNGDKAEEVSFAAELAAEFRQTYNRDIFLDMVCYRKHGHNEADEPKFTQPHLYDIISKHKNPREIYREQLQKSGEVSADLVKQMDETFRKELQDRLNSVRQKKFPYICQGMEAEWQNLRFSVPEDFLRSPETGITEADFTRVAEALCRVPDGFEPLKQIKRLLERRKEMFFEEKVLDWAAAELLAYGSILAEGRLVRMTGQDVKRGTFSHRHAVITDAKNYKPYNNLNHISEDQGKFEIYNSLLSEYGVLGFEFGYALANPNALVIWEAQFGDFANGAQIMIDQFITSCESKWQRMNGLVMLLPHGYEGQGPEHSNARPERFLQLSADYNIVVANLTTPANLFHLMRRQLAWEFRKPAVVMSPKSLLRHPLCVSKVSDFAPETRFQEVIDDEYITAKTKVKKVLFCTGKVYYDLLEKQQAEERKDIAIVRIEQLAPFPHQQVAEIIKKYKKAKLAWVQEEPENMGYWTYLLRVLRCPDWELVSRKASASPATGFGKQHQKEQQQLLDRAFTVA